MAPFATTVLVSWIADQAGPYRVCWRIVGQPDYNCTTDGTHPICAGGGASCSYEIPLTIDHETCDTIMYEGYVQNTCEDDGSPGSLTGRIPFNFAFVPEPACERYLITCLNSPVDSITITDPGSGYDPSASPAPAVTITGGGGTGATADAVVGDGEITGLAITTPGSGYTDGVYVNVPLVTVTGTGTTATADITISGGAITVAVINNPGVDYQTGDFVAPDTGVVGVPGVAGRLTVTSDYGTIIDIIVTNPGSGYTSVPNVIIESSPSDTATADAVLRGCGALTISDCTGATATVIPMGTFQPTETYHMCGPSLPTVPSDFSAAQDGNCLCACQTVNIEVTSGSFNVRYIECDGSVVESLRTAADPAIDVCIVTDSITSEEVTPGTIVITPGAACSA